MKTAHADLPISGIGLGDATGARSAFTRRAAAAFWIQKGAPVAVPAAACAALIFAPAIVGFGMACAAAVVWTWLLDQDPGARDLPVTVLASAGSSPNTVKPAAAVQLAVRPRLATYRVFAYMTSDRRATPELRAAAEMSDRLNGSLLAAYVASDKGASTSGGSDGQTLADNIALAESLGATVVRIDAADISSGLIAFADREGVTHAVLGFSGDRASLFAPGSVVHALCSRARGIEIIAIAQPQG